MFTGLVEALAPVAEVRAAPPGRDIWVQAPELAEKMNTGDSIAVNGCCLTVVARMEGAFGVQAGPETLRRTTLGSLRVGNLVNLERALRAGEPMGGHFVTGHVDGVGMLESRHDAGDWATCWYSVPPELGRYLASKGSIAVDGVSLTLVDVEDARFSVALIPHTLACTTLGRLEPGALVNIEVDLLAKYVERLLAARQP
jgi:riboflavin synthase